MNFWGKSSVRGWVFCETQTDKKRQSLEDYVSPLRVRDFQACLIFFYALLEKDYIIQECHQVAILSWELLQVHVPLIWEFTDPE